MSSTLRFAILVGAAAMVAVAAMTPMFGGHELPWMLAPALPGILMSLVFSKSGQVSEVWTAIFNWSFYALLFVGVERIVRRHRGGQKIEK